MNDMLAIGVSILNCSSFWCLNKIKLRVAEIFFWQILIDFYFSLAEVKKRPMGCNGFLYN
jgi:hypothetical protein